MDTISLILKKENAPNTNFLESVPSYLTEVYNEGKSVMTYGRETINGKLKDFSVIITDDYVKIKEASLQKFIMENSLSHFGRSKIQMAFECLSDGIHLPLFSAEIPMFHFATNIRVNYPSKLYYPYLGNMRSFKRNEQSHGINYRTANMELSIYDKIREMKDHRVAIPELYQHSHYIRFENRYLRQVNKHFKIDRITPKTICDESFYIRLCDELHSRYTSIDKIKQTKIDMHNLTKVSEFKNLGFLQLIEANGGKLSFLEEITERYKKDELTKKQTSDLRKQVNLCSKLNLQTIESDLIIELDRSFKESLEFYR